MTVRQYLVERSTPAFADALAGYIEGTYTSRQAADILGTSHQTVINRAAALFSELVQADLLTIKEGQEDAER